MFPGYRPMASSKAALESNMKYLASELVHPPCSNDHFVGKGAYSMQLY